MVYCPSCGNVNKEGARYCNDCGSEIVYDGTSKPKAVLIPTAEKQEVKPVKKEVRRSKYPSFSTKEPKEYDWIVLFFSFFIPIIGIVIWFNMFNDRAEFAKKVLFLSVISLFFYLWLLLRP